MNLRKIANEIRKVAQLKTDGRVNGLGLPTALLRKLNDAGVERNSQTLKDPTSGSKKISPIYVEKKLKQVQNRINVNAIYGASGSNWFLAINNNGLWDIYDVDRASSPRYKGVTLAQGIRRLDDEPYELWFLGTKSGATEKFKESDVKQKSFEFDISELDGELEIPAEKFHLGTYTPKQINGMFNGKIYLGYSESYNEYVGSKKSFKDYDEFYSKIPNKAKDNDLIRFDITNGEGVVYQGSLKEKVVGMTLADLNPGEEELWNPIKKEWVTGVEWMNEFFHQI